MKALVNHFKNNKKQLVFVSILFLLLLIFLINKFAYKPFSEYKKKLEDEISILENEYNISSVLIPNKEGYINGIKKTKQDIKNIEFMLPPTVTQEMMIFLLNDIEENVGIHFPSVAFNELETITKTNENGTSTNGSNNTDIDTGKIAQDLSEGKDVDIDSLINGETEIVEEEDNYITKFLTEKGVRMSLQTETTITYNELKDMLSYINKYPYKLSVNDLQISREENELSVSIQLSMYGLQSPERVFTPDAIEGYDLGKDSVFSPFDGFGNSFNVGEETVQKGLVDNTADIFIQLMPITADPTTVTIARTKDPSRKSYIYDDKNEFVDVEIEFSMGNGKYYYRYKTKGNSYPRDYSTPLEFDPGSALEIQIFSADRVSDDDKSGVNATLINKTNMPLSVVYYKEDSNRPRFNVVKTEGQVEY